MAFHCELTDLDIHVINTWTYANSAARDAATGFTSDDVYKVAVQTDNNSIWILVNHSPITWQALGGVVVGEISHCDLDNLLVDCHTQYSPLDGSRAYTQPVCGAPPTIGAHLATKAYVDGEIVSDHGDLTGLLDVEDHPDYSTLDGARAYTAPVSGIDPTLDPHLTTKFYVDSQTAAASAGVGALLGIGEWKYDTSTTPPPADKKFSFDTANPSAASKFYLDYTNDNGDDLTNIITAIAGNGNVALYFQNRKDADDAFFIRVGTFTDQTTYGEFDIADILLFDPPLSTTQRYSCIIGEYGAGAFTTFLSLTDTPSAYTGKALQLVRVNAGETALEFAPSGTGGGTGSLTTETAVSEGESSTTSNTYQQKLRLTTTSLAAGTYMIQYSWEIDGDNEHGWSRAQLNDTTDLNESRYDSSLIDYIMISGFAIEALSGVNTIDIDFRANSGGDTMLIRRARIALWRIS